MRRVIRFIRAAWFISRANGLGPQTYWEPSDNAALGHFLNSSTGFRLRTALQSGSISMNAWACRKADQFSCGYATGYAGAIATFISLSAVGPSPDTSEPSAQGAADLEHLIP